MSSPNDENMSTTTPPLLSPPNPLDPLVRTMVDFLEAMRERERREPRPTDNTAIRDRETNVESPPTFQNRQDDVEAFLSHVEFVISAQPSCFRKEEQKIAYLLSYLRGEAFNWVRTYIQADTEQPRRTRHWRRSWEKSLVTPTRSRVMLPKYWHFSKLSREQSTLPNFVGMAGLSARTKRPCIFYIRKV